MRERESLAYFLFSSFMLTFFSGPCKFSLSLQSVDAVMACKGGSVCVCESVENVRIEERGRREERECILFFFSVLSFQFMVHFSSDMVFDSQ